MRRHSKKVKSINSFRFSGRTPPGSSGSGESDLTAARMTVKAILSYDKKLTPSLDNLTLTSYIVD
jgi:hypothetical protein